jgi:hypothetical protein
MRLLAGAISEHTGATGETPTSLLFPLRDMQYPPPPPYIPISLAPSLPRSLSLALSPRACCPKWHTNRSRLLSSPLVSAAL